MFKKILSFGPQVLAMIFLVAFTAFAWQEPTVQPPNPDPNVAVPLNDGSTGQSKKGNLALNTDGTLANGLLVPFGNVGIGTPAPEARLHVYNPNSGQGNLFGQKISYAGTNEAIGSSLIQLWLTAGAITTQATANNTYWNGIQIDMPNITQGAGSGMTSNGIKISGGTVTSGTSYGLIIDSKAGNVGIGTTAPEGTLQVGASPNPALIVKGSSVGIGTTAPISGAELDVRGDMIVTNNPNNQLSTFTLGAGDDLGISFLGSGQILQKMQTQPGVFNRYQYWIEDTLGQVASLSLDRTGVTPGLNLSTTYDLEISASNQLRLYASGSGGITIGASAGNIVLGYGSFGNVGIGLAPAYKLDVGGSIHGSSFPVSSDIRFKENITELTDVLEKIKDIRGVTFDWNDTYASLGRAIPGRQMGLIAQEVEKVFPELVTTWSQEGVNDYRSVDYGRFAAVLLKAIQEQQGQIEELQEEIEALKQR